MSSFDKNEVASTWVESRDSEGRRIFVHPNIVRPGGRKLAVFASDINADDGSLILMGKYLIPLPDLEVNDKHELVKVKKIWVTKDQAKALVRLMGDDYKRLFRQSFATMLFSFAGKAAQLLLRAAGAKLDPARMLLADTLFREVSDEVFKKTKNTADEKVEKVADKVSDVVHKLAEKLNPVLREVMGESFDLSQYVSIALSPVLKEIKDFINE